MRAARLVSLTVVVCIAAAASGCGGGAGSNGASELTKRLSPDAVAYVVADFEKLREDLDLDDEADPLDSGNEVLTAAAQAPLGVIAAPTVDADLVAALQLGEARSAATAGGPGGAVTMISTDADTGEIGSTLGDLGYIDDRGILSRPKSLSVKLDIGVVFVSASPEALRSLPEDAADDLPDPLLDDLDGPWVEVMKLAGSCVNSIGVTSEADGTGEYKVLVDGDADAASLTTGGSAVEFGESDAAGDVVSVKATSPAVDPAALINSRLESVGYEC